MSTDGIQQQYIPASLDGLVYVDVDGLTVNGVPVDLDNLVPYTNATKNLNLGTFNFQTLGNVSAKQHIFPSFTSTLMTGPTTSTIFTADGWGFSNTISTVSLGPTVSTSYLTLSNLTNNSTIVTFQSDGIANFGSTTIRTAKMATGNYDVVNLSTLQNAVAFIENVNALNYVPYNGATDNLNMGASTITTTGLVNVGALRITSSISNHDYSLSVNASDQLEITNLTTAQTLKTDGGSLFIPGNVNCYTGTVFSNDLQLSGTSFLAYGTASQFGTTLNGSGEYEIQDDTGAMRLRLSKTTGLTISTMNITNVPSATPTYALGVNGGGQVVSFAVPTAANLLPLANTWTNTNTFQSTMTTAVGYTTSLNGVLSTNLNDLGFTSASFTTSGITGAYSAPLGTITNVSGSTYQIAQTASGRSIMAISGFTPVVGTTYVFSFNIKCTVGTATIVVEQNNLIRSPQYYQLSTGFNRVIGTFYYDGTGNTIVFNIYTGTLSWNAQWDNFTLGTYYATANCNLSTIGTNRFIQPYNALSTDVSTLVNRATMDSAISAIPLPPNLLPLNNVWTGSNTYNNSLQVAGGNMTCSLGTIAKQTATVGSLVQITGGGATNSPYLEFLFGGNSRGYIGAATATDLDIVAQNGAQLNFYTAGSSRMKIDTSGNMVMNIQKALYLYFNSATNNAGLLTNASGDVSIFTGTTAVSNRMTIKATGDATYTSGDASYIKYGANATWGAYLNVGATTDKSGALNAQVITTNGNLHLDAGNGNTIYYGFYPNSRGTPNTHQFYGTDFSFPSGIPQNNGAYSMVMMLDGNTVKKSQITMRQIYFSNSVAWGGGINCTYAVYKHSTRSVIRLSGKYSGYWGGAGTGQVLVRFYSQNYGVYKYFYYNTFTNNGYNHVTVPLDQIYTIGDLPYDGWYDVYFQSTSAFITDGNDQLTLNVQVLPIADF